MSKHCNSCTLLSKLFQEGKYSDLTIKCQQREWKVHRAVVCMQSPPMAAAIDGNFMEAGSGVIVLEEDEPEIVHLMLEFLYTASIGIETRAAKSSSGPQSVKVENGATPAASGLFGSSAFGRASSPDVSNPSFGTRPAFGAFSAPSTNFPSTPARQTTPFFGAMASTVINVDSGGSGFTFAANNSNPINNTTSLSTYAKKLPRLAKLYVLAEKYDIPPLKRQAITKYQDTLPETCGTDFFVESLKIIFEGTPDTTPPDPLRALAIRTAGENAKVLFEKHEFVSLCKENAEFATQVLQASLGLWP